MKIESYKKISSYSDIEEIPDIENIIENKELELNELKLNNLVLRSYAVDWSNGKQNTSLLIVGTQITGGRNIKKDDNRNKTQKTLDLLYEFTSRGVDIKTLYNNVAVCDVTGDIIGLKQDEPTVNINPMDYKYDAGFEDKTKDKRTPGVDLKGNFVKMLYGF